MTKRRVIDARRFCAMIFLRIKKCITNYTVNFVKDGNTLGTTKFIKQ